MTAAVIWNIVGLSLAVVVLVLYGRLVLIAWREERRSPAGMNEPPTGRG